MKRTLKLSFAVVLVVLLSCTFAFGADDSVKVNLNGKSLEMTTDAVVKDGRTLVPFRSIFEAIGMEVDYNPETKTATGTSEENEIALVLNSKTALVNGKEVALDVPAEVDANGYTLVPLRFVSESVGYYVGWNGDKKEVNIWPVDDSAFAVYDAINKANEDVTSMSVDINMDLGASASYQGESIDMAVKMTGTMDMDMKDEKNPQIAMDAKMSVSGAGVSENADMVMYYTEGYMYMDVDGEKVKVAMPLEEALAQASTPDLAGADIKASDIKGAIVEEKADESKSVTVVVSGESMNDILDTVMSTMDLGELGMDDASMTMSFGDVVLVMEADKDNNLTSMAIKADVTADIEGLKMIMTIDMTMNIKAVGDDVKITLPTDLNTYEELKLEA